MSAALLTAPPAAPPHARWRRGDDEAWVLELSGDWSATSAAVPFAPGDWSAASAQVPFAPGDWSATPATAAFAPGDAAAPPGSRVRLDVSQLSAWSPRLASALWQPLAPLVRRGARVELDTLPPPLREVLLLSLPPRTAPAPPAAAPLSPLARVGASAQAWWRDAHSTLAFVGEVLIAAARALRGAGDMRRSDLAWQLEQTGARSLPIVALVAAMIGLILAYMGGAQLQRFGAKAFIADFLAVAVVREIAPLLTAIMLTGRVGAAFAAQLGSMRANDELDALRSVDIDPVGHLVLPRVLALSAVAPLLTAYAALVALVVGGVAATLMQAVAAEEYHARAVQALSLAHVGVGLVKGTVYGVLVGLAGCRQGLQAGRSAQAVGDAATMAVVKGVLWVIAAASLLTVIFQRLDV